MGYITQYSTFQIQYHRQDLQEDFRASFHASVGDDLRLHCEGLIFDIITFRSLYVFKNDVQATISNGDRLKASWVELITQQNASAKDVIDLIVNHGASFWSSVHLRFFLDVFEFASQISDPKVSSKVMELKKTLEPQLQRCAPGVQGEASNALVSIGKKMPYTLTLLLLNIFWIWSPATSSGRCLLYFVWGRCDFYITTGRRKG